MVLVEYRGKKYLVLNEKPDNYRIVEAKKDGTRMPRRESIFVSKAEVKVIQ